MTRALAVVSSHDPEAVRAALREALSGDGPAILPHHGTPIGVPAEIERRVAVVVETSGSTGRPKRVALSADALLASAAASEAAIGGPGQWLLALPTHYIAGINVLVRSLSAQTTPVAMEADGFTVQRFTAAASSMTGHARFTALVPAQLARLLDDESALGMLRRFDRILVGGQASTPGLLDLARDLGVAVTSTYGSSETSGGCVYDGVPIGNTGIRIAGGRIELAGSVLAEGYVGDPDRTALAFHTEGGQRWYRTDDAGELAAGVLSITGRVDDVIISGGEKVSLAAVELAVRAIDGLADAVVVAAPSESWGQVPVVVTTRSVPMGELRSSVAGILGRAAAPDRIVVVGELPLLPSGKPDRLAIARLALQ